MTKAGEKWIAEMNKKRPLGGEVGIIHPIDGLALLRAFCAEVDELATRKALANGWLKAGYQEQGAAFVQFKHELLGD